MNSNNNSNDRWNRKLLLNCIANLAVCGSALWAMYRVNYIQYPYAMSSYVYLMCHGILGFRSAEVSMCHEDNRSRKILSILPLGMLNFELLATMQQYSLLDDRIFLSTYALSTILTTVLDLMVDEQVPNGTIMTLLGNVCCLGFISTLTGNTYGIVAALWKFAELCLFESNVFEYGANDETGIGESAISNFSLAAFCVLTACSVGHLDHFVNHMQMN